MPTTRHLRLLTRYTAWANERVFAALGQLPAAEVERGSGSMTRGDPVLHVVNPKRYHRGVVADVLDLPVLLRDAPPPFEVALSA